MTAITEDFKDIASRMKGDLKPIPKKYKCSNCNDTGIVQGTDVYGNALRMVCLVCDGEG